MRNNKRNIAKLRKKDMKQRYKKYKNLFQQKKGFYKYKVLIIVLILLLAICAIGTSVFYSLRGDKTKINEGDLTIEKQGEDRKIESEELSSVKKTSTLEQVEEDLSKMSVEDKVAQLLIITPEDLTGMRTVIQAGEKTRDKLMQYPVGGLLYGSQNFEVAEQLSTMIMNVNAYSKYPILTLVDEEGGNRILNMNKMYNEVGLLGSYINEEVKLIDAVDLEQQTVSIEKYREENYLEKLEQGVQMLLVEESFDQVYNKMLDDVRSGRISVELLDESVKEILIFKYENDFLFQ